MQISDLQLAAAAAGMPDMATMQHMAAPQQHGQLEQQQQQQLSGELPDSAEAAATAIGAMAHHAHADRFAEEQHHHQMGQEPPGVAHAVGLHHLHQTQAAMQAAVGQHQQQQQHPQHAGSEGDGRGNDAQAVHAAHLAQAVVPLPLLDPAALAALTAGHGHAMRAAALPTVGTGAGLTLPLVHAPEVHVELSDEQHDE